MLGSLALIDDPWFYATAAVAVLILGIAKGEEIPFTCDLLFTSTRPTFDSPSLCDMGGESRTFSFYYPKTRPGLDRYAIVSSTNALWDDWAKLDDDGYARAKAKLISQI